MERRVKALEQRITTRGCATCREWHESTQIRTITTQDDEANHLVARPAVCPNCGRVTPTTITVLIVQIDDEEEEQ